MSSINQKREAGTKTISQSEKLEIWFQGEGKSPQAGAGGKTESEV